MSNTPTPADQPRRQSVLGIILLALHPLFGITAVIGMLISTTALKSVEGTLYHSHLKWQIATFWIGSIAYFIAFSLWNTLGITWPIVVVFVFVAYRVATNLKHWSNHEAITRQF
jgi:uncharacterized membrane protein